MRRTLVLALVGALALGMSAVAPVLAAATNDTVATATAVAIPSTTTEDTTVSDATDNAETALNEFCGAPVVEHGVWFKVTPTTDRTIAFDTQASDYSAGIMLFAGTPTAAGLITCGPGLIIGDLTANTTYNLLVFGDGFNTEATSGNLSFTVRETVPPPSLDLTINKSGTVDKSGTVHLWGMTTCTSDDGSGFVVEIFGDVTQRVGRLLIRGFFDTSPFTPCDGRPHRWDAFFQGDNGIFAGGKAVSVAIGFGCADFCSEAFAQATVQLKRNGK
jgi:hypothetical protein